MTRCVQTFPSRSAGIYRGDCRDAVTRETTTVPARLIGVIEAEQTEDGKTVRNDRLVAVAKNAHDYRDLRTLADLNANLLKELEHFFVSYNEMKGRKFAFLGTRGPQRARKLLEAAMRGG